MSWKTKSCYAEDVSKTSWTCLEVVLKKYLEHVLKTCLEDALRTCFKDVFKMSWRKAKCLLGMFVSNKSKCVPNKSIFHKSTSDESKVNPTYINWNPIISIFVLFWNTSSISILRIKIAEVGKWARKAIKTKF